MVSQSEFVMTLARFLIPAGFLSGVTLAAAAGLALI